LRALLERARSVAVVGLSADPMRDSHGVAAYLKSQGYRILPVHPGLDRVLGEPCYARLADLPETPDVVDVFRRSDHVPEIVEQTIAIAAPVLWLQKGVVHVESAERARDAGIDVVMDRCMLEEHRRLVAS
jgi:predicted CoA-binding protein